MDFSSCGWDNAKFLIFSNNVFENLIYYSHFLSAIPAISIGFFVFIKDRKSLTSKLLFINTLLFSIWVYFDLILWATEKPQYTMFFWSIIVLVEVLIYSVSLYFILVFVEEKDISLFKKFIIFILISPVIIFVSTRYNLKYFDFTNCDRGAAEGIISTYYIYFVELVFTAWIILFAIIKYRKSAKEKRKRIVLVTIGIFFFLFLFSLGNIIGSFTEDWRIPHYGLFGMPIFVGFLAYLIVRYKAFNTKLLGTQVLVSALVILIGSELFFADSVSNRILILITLAISLGFGYILIKSVKSEVERKEQLQMMSDKLAQANDQLRKLDNAKTEFISIASHQLRTPLTAVKGFISLLLEGSYGPLKKEHQEVLNKVYTSNERLIDLVEDLLNISRIESGRMEYNFEKWDLVKMCSELADSFVFKAKDRGLYLDFKKPDKSLPEVETDGGKLREVISNLIDNAIKYSQKGGATIRVEFVSQVQSPKSKAQSEGSAIRVSISDTGIGIPATELPYLFAKFSRGKDTSRLNTGGTGLGLYVGRSIMEALGGKIWAESEGAGKGSKFIVEVPVEKAEQ